MKRQMCVPNKSVIKLENEIKRLQTLPDCAAKGEAIAIAVSSLELYKQGKRPRLEYERKG